MSIEMFGMFTDYSRKELKFTADKTDYAEEGQAP
jgi:hypothetical protein